MPLSAQNLSDARRASAFALQRRLSFAKALGRFIFRIGRWQSRFRIR